MASNNLSTTYQIVVHHLSGQKDDAAQLRGVLYNSSQIKKIIEDNITYINSTFETIDPQNLSRNWEQVRQYILTRLQSNQLYLAIIGEFSVGKSTFINSLLRKELLTARARPTTAIATYIEYGEFDIQYEDKNGKFHSLKDDISKIYHEKDELSICDIISRFTSNPKITESLQKVYIQYLSELLEQGLVIIDTPGTNAIIEGHEQITRGIVQDIADACIFLFDVSQAGKESTFDFIEQNLKEHLNRFLFVATKVDTVIDNELLDRDEIEEQLQEATVMLNNKIKKRLKISAPNVYLLAPKRILSQPHNESNSHYYHTLQETFEKDLFEFLQKEKGSIILKRLIIEEKNILKELHDKIESIRCMLTKELEKLQKIKIPDLQGFLENKFAELQEYIEPLTERVIENSKLTSTLETIYTDMAQMIFNTTNKNQLAEVCKNELSTYTGNNIPKKLHSVEKKLNKNFFIEFKLISSQIENEFREAYNQLQQFKNEDQLRISFEIDAQAAARMGFKQDSLNEMITNIENSGSFAGSGAITGAIIGSFIPGIGTIIGGIIGGIFGSLFGKSFEEVRQEVWEKTFEYVREKFAQWAENLDNQLTQMSEEYQNFLIHKLNYYYSAYNQKIEDLISVHEKKKRESEQKIQHLKEVYTEIEIRKNQLIAIQESIEKSLG